MTRKLTLKMNDKIIERAKRYAAKRRQSLSQLVEDYFRFLSEKEPAENIRMSPTVEELSGSVKLPSGYDPKTDYSRYLEQKYS